MSLIRLLIVALAAAFACSAASAAVTPPPWKTVTFARHAGPVSAVMTEQRQAHGDGFFTFRQLHLVVRVRGKTVLDRQLCNEVRCGPGSHHSLALQNVWGGSLPEAVIGIYTGGAHCCFDTIVAFTDPPLAGRLAEHDFGDPGYDGERHDGVYEFMTADDRFAYAFTSFAGSGLPAQVLMLSPAGKFVDITSTRLDVVAKDAKFYWRAYASDRGTPDADVRGVLAAWCADEYRLEEGGACRAELAAAVRNGWVAKAAGDIWPAGAKFVTALDRSLRKWGYTS